MRFYAVGLNHECTSLERTETFALSAEEQEALYASLSLSADAEVVVLSTCNRTEAYLYGTEADLRQVKALLGQGAGAPWPEETAFQERDEAAVRHLLQVTSGLRSVVLGERQVFAQVKAAYERAVEAGGVHSVMHRLLHTAFRAAKRISSETGLVHGAASVSTAAVEMARQALSAPADGSGLEDAAVALVGAGKMGRLALEALVEDSPQSLTVVNRSPDRARDVASSFGGDTEPWAERHEAAAAADLVLVATGASDPVLRAAALPAPDEATLVVDVAMPRNVDPAVGDRPKYRLYDLDDLQAWTDEVRERRADAVPQAESICEELLEDFVTWVFHQQALQPAIQAIRSTFDTIRQQEVDRHAHRTSMDREEVDRLTESIMQKLLAVPIVRLKNVDPESIDFVQGIELLHALFAPSDEEAAGRPLTEAPDADPPDLGEAPSRCPYLTHNPGADGNETEEVQQALRLSAAHQAVPHPEGENDR
ncbi:glutamyl-tRNA reductase [Salinibacter altiplanensis]|uniref:glutamyl-tRNA reductase n=1 Tax=Salinibacter altiplanensis TaxID=1803181 RepID=UPI000C9FBC98|nr:glutamyl-tRNA reductase [Salinibacter altiplanensis]